MTLYPQAQMRAQAEIDAVIGKGGRLPDFSDEASLPYVGAVVKEVLRYVEIVLTIIGRLVVLKSRCLFEGGDLLARWVRSRRRFSQNVP